MGLGIKFHQKNNFLTGMNKMGFAGFQTILKNKYGFEIRQGSDSEIYIEICCGFDVKLWLDGKTLYGEAQNNIGGAGGHKQAVGIIDLIKKDFGTQMIVEDDTGYYIHRDFKKLQKEMIKWLKERLEIALKSGESEAPIYLGWDIYQYHPVGFKEIGTPCGAFTREYLKSAIDKDDITAFADQFFVWPNETKDAYYYRNSAVYKMWNDAVWKDALNHKENTEKLRIIQTLTRARDMKDDIPLPIIECNELCRQAGEKEIFEGENMTYPIPVGYRRGKIIYHFPLGFIVTFEGKIRRATEISERDGGIGFSYNGIEILFYVARVEDDTIKNNEPFIDEDYLFIDEIQRIEFNDDLNYLYKAKYAKANDGEKEYFHLMGYITNYTDILICSFRCVLENDMDELITVFKDIKTVNA